MMNTPKGPLAAPASYEAALEELEQLVSRIESGQPVIAAVIIEPIQGEGGFIVPAEGFLPAIAQWCTDNGVVFEGSANALTMHLVREAEDERLARTDVSDAGDVRAELTLPAGQKRGVLLVAGSHGPAREVRVHEAWDLFHDIVAFWKSWLAQSTYAGRWRETINRSAITLKLMTYAPTGGLVAAPTAALPEQIGGERNWDYRYTWVRDASFSVYSLLGLGFTDEAVALGRWLRDRVEERSGDAGSPLDIMYRVDGSSDLREEVLGHWEGYRGSAPVRIGNGAFDQRQNDVYGALLDSMYDESQRA